MVVSEDPGTGTVAFHYNLFTYLDLKQDMHLLLLTVNNFKN